MRPTGRIAASMIAVSVLFLVLGGLAGYYFGVNNGLDKTVPEITSFEECAAAGYPIMESYPEQCSTPDGKHFVRDISNDPDYGDLPDYEGVACTMDAMECPDGTFVGRVPPTCEFAPCPGN